MAVRCEGFIEAADAARHAIGTLLAFEAWLRGEGLSLAEREHTLSLEAVIEVEAAMSLRLPTALLALMAARTRAASESWRVQLGGLAEHTALARQRGLPRELIAVGNRANEFLCFERGTNESNPWLTLFDHTDRSTRKLRFDEWISQQIDDVISDLDPDEQTVTRLESLGEQFRPELRASPGRENPRRIVMHPKFGRGVVLSEIDGGTKLEVQFEHHGRRVMLATFLVPGDE